MSTYHSILTSLEKKQYQPIYLLMGEEGYYIDLISDCIANTILTEEEKKFNFTVLYGRDVQADDVINAAKRYPMGAAYNIVIVKEAQSLAKIDRLEYYFQQPLKSTILVIEYRHGKVDARKKMYKLAEKQGAVLLSNRLYDNKVPEWIINYAQTKHIKVSVKSAQLLCDFLGADLSKIVNELNKLIITLPQGTTEITSKHIEEKIGISRDYNNFEFLKALTTKNAYKSNQIVNYFQANPKNNPVNLTLSTLFNFFSNLMIYYYLPNKNETSVAQALGVAPYFVREYATASSVFGAGKVMKIIALIRECDARTKGVGNVSTTSGELLKELVYQILH